MNTKRIIKELSFAALAVMCLATFNLTINAQNAGDIIFAEIAADPSSAVITTPSEPHAEYFVLCNRTTNSAFNLNGFTVTDNSATVLTLPSYNLTANSCVAVVSSANGTDVFGANPNGYGCAAAPTNAIVVASNTFFNGLSNTADRLGLFTPGNVLIDGVSYGTDTTDLNPAATDVFNNSGATLIRTGYPTNSPSTLPDTNTNADFTTRAGTPCDAPLGTTAASATISGRVVSSNGRGLPYVRLTLTGGDLEEPIYAATNGFGRYRFPELPSGETYFLTVSAKRFRFAQPTRVINLDENLTDVNFIGEGR